MWLYFIDVRHDSKRDSIRRKVVNEFNEINGFICRQHTMSIGADADDSNQTNLEKLQKYNDEAKKPYNSQHIYFHPTFKDNLYEKLMQIGAFDKNDDMNEKIVKATLQACL